MSFASGSIRVELRFRVFLNLSYPRGENEIKPGSLRATSTTSMTVDLLIDQNYSERPQ